MISKKIHYCWFGGAQIPEKDQRCIESWRRVCPEYEIIQWDETNYDVTKNTYMREAYQEKKWGFVPDFARLDIVNSEGGIYLDTDVEVLRPFDVLLPDAMFCGFESQSKVAFGLGFGALAGHPMLKELLSSYDAVHFRTNTGSLNMLPSPEYQTEILLKHGLKLDGSRQKLDCDIDVLPMDWLCPQSFTTGKTVVTKNTLSIHHYSMSWASSSRKVQRDIATFLCSKGLGEKEADFFAKWVAVLKERDFSRVKGKILNKMGTKQ